MNDIELKEKRRKRCEYMYRWRSKHREEMAAKSREYYAKHREDVRRRAYCRYWENPEEHRAQRRKYVARWRSKAVKAAQEWKKRNPEKVAEHRRKYREKHREQRLEEQYQRRIRKRLGVSAGSISPSAIAQLLNAAKRCPDCKCILTSDNRSVDHIYPLSRGGLHTLFNVRIVCRSCNSRKHTNIPEQVPLGSFGG